MSVAILLCAGMAALLISLSGQREVLQNAQNSQLVGQILASVAKMSLSFDSIQERPSNEELEIALQTLESANEQTLQATLALDEKFASGKLAERNQAKLADFSISPLEDMKDIIALAQMVIEGEADNPMVYRSSQIGVGVTQELLNTLEVMNGIEASAAEQVADRQRVYALAAVAVSFVGIFVVVVFVYLPMERFIVASQDRIQRNKARAEAASEAKSAFLETMSHEVRTPLNGVLGLSEELLDGEQDPQRRKSLELIVNSGSSLLSLINDVLDISKIEAGNAKLEMGPFNLGKLCKEVIDLFQPAAKSKGIELRLAPCPQTVPSQVIGAHNAVRQVLLNLVGNAVKFTESGEIVVSVDEPLVLEGKTLLCGVTVKDTGIGISQDALPRIFDRFTQADSSTTTRFGGSGLGLAIAKSLCNEMKGDIEVESELAKGSTFKFGFSAEADQAVDHTRSSIETERMFSGLALVADDNKVNRLVAKKFLSSLGMQTEVAADGVEAVRMYQSKKFDLVLMDVRMPNMDGLAATKEIRAIEVRSRSEQVPVVGLSANALAEHVSAGMEAGMDAYLTKPLTKQALSDALNEHLRS